MCKILVVDDEPLIRRNLRRMLERSGHDVRESGDGGEALRLMDAGLPDIIITDVHMPGMDGLELTGVIRQSGGPQPRIIVCSGSGDGPDLERAAALGASAVLVKPFTYAELVASIQNVQSAA